jgi:hypothetical protein
MPSEKSSIVSFQPSRRCMLGCPFLGLSFLRAMKSWATAPAEDARPIRLQGCRPSLIDKVAGTYYSSRLPCGGGWFLCAARALFVVR